MTSAVKVCVRMQLMGFSEKFASLEHSAFRLEIRPMTAFGHRNLKLGVLATHAQLVTDQQAVKDLRFSQRWF
jgi:hypothetical protein